MSSLTDRIALILQSEAASDALAEVIDDAQDELEAAQEACAEAQEQVLDPLSSSSSVTKAKREADDLTLQISRLEAAIGRLSDKLNEARHREKEAAKLRLYEEAKSERDALVEDIRTIYPEAAAKIAALLPRIEPLDQRIMAINRDLPEGAPHLEFVEHIARDRPNHQGTYLSRSVRLPALLHKDIYWSSFWPEKQH
jgi:chromosome segregation ATPase